MLNVWSTNPRVTLLRPFHHLSRLKHKLTCMRSLIPRNTVILCFQVPNRLWTSLGKTPWITPYSCSLDLQQEILYLERASVASRCNECLFGSCDACSYHCLGTAFPFWILLLGWLWFGRMILCLSSPWYAWASNTRWERWRRGRTNGIFSKIDLRIVLRPTRTMKCASESDMNSFVEAIQGLTSRVMIRTGRPTSLIILKTEPNSFPAPFPWILSEAREPVKVGQTQQKLSMRFSGELVRFLPSQTCAKFTQHNHHSPDEVLTTSYHEWFQLIIPKHVPIRPSRVPRVLNSLIIKNQQSILFFNSPCSAFVPAAASPHKTS